MKKWIVYAGCMTALLLAAGCQKQTVSKDVPKLLEPATEVMDVAKVTKQDICNIRLFDGQVVPYTEELGFSTDGMIDEIKVKLGDTVKKGDVLATLNGATDNARYEFIIDEIEQSEKSFSEGYIIAEYDIKIAEMQAEQIKDKIKNSKGAEKKQLKKELAIKNVDIEIEKQKLKDSKELNKIELDELKRQKKHIEKEIKEYSLISSMDGVVTCIAVKEGAQVSNESFVIAVSDNSKKMIKAEFVLKKDVERADRCYVKYGDKEYDVTQLPYDGDEIKELIAQEKTAYVYYELATQDVNFDVGDYIDVYVETGSQKDALVVPVNAVYGDGSEKYIYKKKGETKVKTAVTVGTATPSFVQITDGVAEGDEVYVK